jgi:polyisoprenoid-binding protein YceI
MRSFRLSVVLTPLFLAAALAQAADTYKIDTVHSSVGFSVKHMMVSNVKGLFRDFSGTIMLDEKDVTKSSVMVTIKAASIDTGNANRDNHLRTGDFLQVDKYPEITFTSKSVEKTATGYNAKGTLTIRGVSKDVVLPFTMAGPVKDAFGKSRLGAEAGLEINRQDYGVAWNKTMDNGGLVVADTVKIDLGVEAVKEEAGAPAKKK